MLLSGNMIYLLTLGFVIIVVELSLTEGLVKIITDDFAEYKKITGYTKFVLYSMFLVIGAGTIFATYTGFNNVIANICWVFV